MAKMYLLHPNDPDQKIRELPWSEENAIGAEAKGYQQLVPLVHPKDPEQKVRYVGSEEAMRAIKEKGYMEAGAMDRMEESRKSDRERIPAWKSAAQSAGSSMAWGLDDEIIGAASGAKNVLQGGDFSEGYEQSRDYIRGQKKRLQEANPITYLAGGLAGGLTTPGAFAGKAATLGGQIGRGALSGAIGGGLQGVGDTEATDLKGMAKEATQSALVGGALGGTLGGLIRPRRTLEDAASAAKTMRGGFAEGVRKESLVDDIGFPEWTTIPALSRAVKGASNTVKALKDKIAKDAEFKVLMSEAKKASGSIDMPDDEFALLKLLEPGQNDVKKFFAEKAATIYPGQVDANIYNRILEKGVDERVIARALDKKEVAKELKPLFESTEELFKKARDTRFVELEDIARKGYQDNAKDVRDRISNLLASAQDKGSPSELKKMKGPLSDVRMILEEGKGMPSAKLPQGYWDDIADSDKFTRLQAARREIDSSIPWDRIKMGKKPTASERELIDIRREIDSLLKMSPEKAEADDLYKQAKQLEKKFFNIVDYKGEGVDEAKIARLFNDTDSANRFMNYMDELESFVNRPDLPQELKEGATDLLGKLKRTSEIAQQQRDLNAFRFKQGPSSPAIERQTSVLKGSKPLEEAIQSPAGFVSSADQFVSSQAQKRFGKNWGNLSESEKRKLLKFWTWAKNNPDAMQVEFDRTWSKLK